MKYHHRLRYHRNATTRGGVFEVENDKKNHRRDMMDDALLRPGRLEVQIEIGLPKEKGRTQILHIHTKKVTYTPIITTMGLYL